VRDQIDGSSLILDSYCVTEKNGFNYFEEEDTPSSASTFLKQLGATLHLEREESPVNEFSRLQELIHHCFPHLFPFGFGAPAQFTSNAFRHSLLQFHGKHARDSNYIIFGANGKIRHGSVTSVAVHVNRHPTQLKAFAATLQTAEFRSKLTEAVANPTGDAALEVRKLCLPILSMAGASIPFSVGGRRTAMSKAVSQAYTYGGNSVFLTISQNDVNDLVMIRQATDKGKNECFPTTFGHDDERCRTEDEMMEFLQHAQHHVADSTIQSGGEQFRFSRDDLIRLVANNPVAAAVSYRRKLYVLLNELLGLNPEEFGKLSVPLQDRENKGYIYGPLTSYFGCTEAQQRGALHAHLALIGGFFSPELLEQLLKDPELRKLVLEMMDVVNKASVTPEAMIEQMLGLHFREKKEAMTYIPPGESKAEFQRVSNKKAVQLQVHTHQVRGGTCMKGKSGLKGCRMAYPRENCGTSKLTRLLRNSASPKYSDVRIRSSEVLTSPASIGEIDYQRDPLDLHHLRKPKHWSPPLLVVEPKRPRIEARRNPMTGLFELKKHAKQVVIE
jgi:Helitron helicase-like domain at N-terminus